MAGKEVNAADADNTSETKPKGRLKPLIIVGVLMLVEGVAIFALMSFFTAPPDASSAAEGEDALDFLNLDDEVEIQLCEIDAFNRKEGTLYVYHMQLSALVAADDVQAVTRFIDARSASIKDRIQVVIRASDPKHLNDPTLETVKRQILFELNNLLGGKELIRDVLVSKLLQSRTRL